MAPQEIVLEGVTSRFACWGGGGHYWSRGGRAGLGLHSAQPKLHAYLHKHMQGPSSTLFRMPHSSWRQDGDIEAFKRRRSSERAVDFAGSEGRVPEQLQLEDAGVREVRHSQCSQSFQLFTSPGIRIFAFVR